MIWVLFDAGMSCACKRSSFCCSNPSNLYQGIEYLTKFQKIQNFNFAAKPLFYFCSLSQQMMFVNAIEMYFLVQNNIYHEPMGLKGRIFYK